MIPNMNTVFSASSNKLWGTCKSQPKTEQPPLSYHGVPSFRHLVDQLIDFSITPRNHFFCSFVVHFLSYSSSLFTPTVLPLCFRRRLRHVTAISVQSLLHDCIKLKPTIRMNSFGRTSPYQPTSPQIMFSIFNVLALGCSKVRSNVSR